jgi:large subunit ribosomal protein L3
MIGLIGKKISTGQLFNESGLVIPVTILKAGPCSVIQKKSQEKEGYGALQLGFEDKKEKSSNSPERGHFRRVSVKPKKILREFRVTNLNDYKETDEIRVDIFKVGDYVDVIGTSKGRGFAGVMKRWGFAGGPATHGAHQWHRRPGSIGSGAAYPGRVYKGKRMPGRMGGVRVTCQNLEIMHINVEEGLLTVKGAVPGANGGYVIIRRAIKKPGARSQESEVRSQKPEVRSQKKV